MTDTLLHVDDLHVSFRTDGAPVRAVSGISFYLAAGETLAIVGESGSGKTVSSRAAIGLLPETASIQGSAQLQGAELIGMRGEAIRRIRGDKIAMIFQEPSTALDPVRTVGWQICEALLVHRRMSKKAAWARAIELMDMVGIPEPSVRVSSYPHQLSGGQKQRVMIAMALSCDPQVLIADEPTTALDVTVQAQILDLLHDLKERLGTSIILITHNMGVVADMADRVAVMYQGKIVEQGLAKDIFESPQHPYTKHLLESVPHLGNAKRFDAGAGTAVTDAPMTADASWSAAVSSAGAETPGTVSTSPRAASPGGGGTSDDASMAQPARPAMSVDQLCVDFPVRHGFGVLHAVKDVTLDVFSHEIVALVGESGSGKTTIGRCAVGLQKATRGEVNVLGVDIGHANAAQMRHVRRRVGFVFQDPAASLNPRMSVGACIAEPMRVHNVGDRHQQDSRVRELLDAVELPADFAARFPHELSGGQRQRVSLARALVLGPEFLVADEPTSALDVSVQARVLEVFARLHQEMGFACLFVTHDLAVVDQLAHRIAVMHLGEVAELGTREDVLRNPQVEYTRELIAAVPVPDVAEQSRRRELRRATRRQPA